MDSVDRGVKEVNDSMANKPKRKRRRGAVGRDVFAEVQRLVAGGKTSKLKAFKQIAQKSGRNVGTVAANYYRVARQQGVPLQGRGRRATAAASSGSRRAQGVLRRAQDVIRELAETVAKQEQELTRLRKENARLEAIRKLVRR